MIAVESSAEMPMSDMAGIGRALRQGRVAKGITVEEAALELHLQIRQINALEAGDAGIFSSPAFTKGYLRACARLYSLDGDRLIAMYDSFQPSLKTHIPAIVANSKKHVLGSRNTNKAALFVSVLVLSIAVIWSIFWLGSHYWSKELFDKANDVLQSAFDVEIMSPDVVETSGIVESIPQPNVPSAAPGLTGNPVPEPVENQSVMAPEVIIQDSVLHIEFIDDCWVQLKTDDGSVLYEKVHKKGEIFDMPVKTPLHVWFGRSAAVNVSYNGAVVPVPVRPGFQSAQFILGDEPSSGEIE